MADTRSALARLAHKSRNQIDSAKRLNEKSRFKCFDPRKISTFSSEKAYQAVAVEIYSNPAFHYLDLTCVRRLFFARSGRKVVISMRQNSCDLDISFTELTDLPSGSVRSYGSERRSAVQSRSLFSRPHRPHAGAGGRRGVIRADCSGYIEVMVWRGWG